MVQPDEIIGGSSLKRQENVEIISSSVFDNLNNDVLIEILVHLPLKPANLCRCISVRFRSVISSANFARRYLNHHQINDPFSFYYNYSSFCRSPSIDLAFGSPIFESSGFSLSFLPSEKEGKKENFRYLASNNGLVLCCATERCPVVYFVCNPLTKQLISLPPPPTDVKTLYVGFICNPQYSHVDKHGQYIDHHEPGRSSFKVVFVEAKYGKSLSSCIFCSETEKWTKEEYNMSCLTPTPDHDRFQKRHYSAVVCGGLLHWVNLLYHIISIYHPTSGTWETIELPCEIERGTSPDHYCLGESGGRLRYCYFSKGSQRYQVWELKDYSNGGEWLLLHKVHLDEMNSTVHTISKISMVVRLPHPLNQDIIFFWCPIPAKIVEYNMRSKLLKLPCLLRDAKVERQRGVYLYPFVLPCWPTTVPLIQKNCLS